MSGLINWIKTNPVNLACVIVIAIAISSLFWLTGPARSGLQEQANKRTDLKRQIEALIGRKVEIPNDDPDEPVKDVKLTVNEAAVKQLTAAYERMQGDYASLFAEALAFNQAGAGGTNPHEVLVDGVLPKPRSDTARFESRKAYRRQIEALYAKLGAGMPPTSDELEEPKDPERPDRPSTDTVDDENAIKKQMLRRMNIITAAAAGVQVFAEPPRFAGGEDVNGIFTIGQWARAEDKPTVEAIWNGQMDLWLQQDVVAAIVRANTDPSGQASSVLTNPVKKIIAIEVVPGYVTRSAMADLDFEIDLNKPLPSDFRASPTGRTSNPLYDVRQVNVALVVDLAELPRVLNAFTEVNFITPIVKSIATIDQAEELRERHTAYGNNVTVAEVHLQIESLWLRRWTAGHTNADEAAELGEKFDPGLMPDAVRVALGMDPRSENYEAGSGQTVGTGTGPDAYEGIE